MAEHDRQGFEQTQAFGEQGEPCQECGSPLAADQRYCLNCGRRRGGPRIDYGRFIGDAGGPAVEPGPKEPPAPPAPADQAQQRDYAPLAAVGGIAVLGLMLLVGVLVGKGNDQPVPAPAPRIVTVDGTGGETAAAAKP